MAAISLSDFLKSLSLHDRLSLFEGEDITTFDDLITNQNDLDDIGIDAEATWQIVEAIPLAQLLVAADLAGCFPKLVASVPSVSELCTLSPDDRKALCRKAGMSVGKTSKLNTFLQSAAAPAAAPQAAPAAAPTAAIPTPADAAIEVVRYADPSKRGKMVFIGNPGTGKSTLMNCYVGEPMFSSGLSKNGVGITYQMDQQISKSGRVFMDTPGLADLKLRKQAGKAIEKALKQGGEFYMVFAITLEAGRVKPDDLTTMKLVFDACQLEVKDHDFAIVVNKCPKRFFRDGDQEALKKELHAQCRDQKVHITDHIHFAPLVHDWDCESNVCQHLLPDTVDFLDGVPKIAINPLNIIKIQTDQFESMKKKMQEEMEELRGQLKTQQALLLAHQRKQSLPGRVVRGAAALAGTAGGAAVGTVAAVATWDSSKIQKCREAGASGAGGVAGVATGVFDAAMQCDLSAIGRGADRGASCAEAMGLQDKSFYEGCKGDMRKTVYAD